MTPQEAWAEYTADLPSPQSYLDFGWFILMTSALERRIWYYDTNRLYVNLFVTLVGRPALGKSILLTTVASLLKELRTDKRAKVKTAGGTMEEATRFAVGADCATFQQILMELADSRLAIQVQEGGKTVPYSYCALAFILEELGSLMQRHRDDVVKFLLRAYDSNDYEYKTRHQEPVILRRVCMNLFAGTQMEFMQEANDYKIFGQGFSSRTIWLFETQRRFTRFHIESTGRRTAEARKVIIEHLQHLSTLYGQLQYSPEVHAFLEDWYINTNAEKEVTGGPRMEGYYGRKKVHLLKIAAAIHFSSKYDLEITLDEVKQAIAILDEIEPRMAAGLNVVGRNRMSPFARNILDILKGAGPKGVHYPSLASMFHSDLSLDELNTILEELTILGKANKRYLPDEKTWNYLSI